MREKMREIYECKICDYDTSRKDNYDRHIKSKKHLLHVTNNVTNNKKCNKTREICYHECEFCEEIFNNRMSLWRHKKNKHSNESTTDEEIEEERANEENETIISEEKLPTNNINNTHHKRMGMFMDYSNTTSKQVESLTNIILKQQEQIGKIVEGQQEQKEINEKILDIASKPQIINNTTNNTNTTNNNMTINVFLNEKCKDAVNLIDFVKNLNISWEDVQNTGKSTLENTISNLLIENMKDMDITKRPIHCTDKKRLQYYVKDGEWKKQNADEVIDSVIYNVSKRHINNVVVYGEEHPEWIYDDDNTDSYFNITTNSMIYGHEMEKRRNRVKKLLSNETFLKMPLTFTS